MSVQVGRRAFPTAGHSTVNNSESHGIMESPKEQMREFGGEGVEDMPLPQWVNVKAKAKAKAKSQIGPTLRLQQISTENRQTPSIFIPLQPSNIPTLKRVVKDHKSTTPLQWHLISFKRRHGESVPQSAFSFLFHHHLLL